MELTFKKNERITSRSLIDFLFSGKDSRAVTAFPLKAVYTLTEHHGNDAAVQILTSVPKRHFKRAVKRNRIKRQIREAYRLNKSIITGVPDGRQLLIAFIYIADREFATADIEKRVVKLLNKISGMPQGDR